MTSDDPVLVTLFAFRQSNPGLGQSAEAILAVCLPVAAVPQKNADASDVCESLDVGAVVFCPW